VIQLLEVLIAKIRVIFSEAGFFSSLKVNDSFNAIISDADAVCR